MQTWPFASAPATHERLASRTCESKPEALLFVALSSLARNMIRLAGFRVHSEMHCKACALTCFDFDEKCIEVHWIVMDMNM